MNLEKLRRFEQLLLQQIDGAEHATDRLAAMHVTLDDGYCLFNLYEQWKGAFSFSPGQPAVLGPIHRLSKRVLQSEIDDTSQLFANDDWKQLVQLRGPFDCAVWYTCAACGERTIGFGESGFLDQKAAACDRCGDVIVQSIYDDSTPAACSCSGRFVFSGCSSCGSTTFSDQHYFSSYEYFLDHTWRRV